MSKEFDDLCEEIEGRSGAAERIEAEVNRMIGVLELEKLRRQVPEMRSEPYPRC